MIVLNSKAAARAFNPLREIHGGFDAPVNGRASRAELDGLARKISRRHLAQAPHLGHRQQQPALAPQVLHTRRGGAGQRTQRLKIELAGEANVGKVDRHRVDADVARLVLQLQVDVHVQTRGQQVNVAAHDPRDVPIVDLLDDGALRRHDQHRSAQHDVAAPPLGDPRVGLLAQRGALAHQPAQHRQGHEQQQYDHADHYRLECHCTGIADRERHARRSPSVDVPVSCRKPAPAGGHSADAIRANCGTGCGLHRALLQPIAAPATACEPANRRPGPGIRRTLPCVEQRANFAFVRTGARAC